MAPTFYHYLPLSMDDYSKEMPLGNRKQWGRLWILPLLLVVVSLLVAVIVLAVEVNSKACKDGLQAEQECRNITHLLENQLTRAQEVLLETEVQAAACNRTVESLIASLEIEKTQAHKLVLKLQEEKEELKRKYEDTKAELEQLRYSSTNSGNTLSHLVVAVLLILNFSALFA